MQAAAHRLPAPRGQREADNLTVETRFAVDDSGLLDALPIAAAIIERGSDDALRVTAHNSRFFDTVRQSTCEAEDWNQAGCLQCGPIAELLQAYFDGSDADGELDFRDGEGLTARYFRVKLAPLPRNREDVQRCLLSVVDRTVEVEAERALRSEMLRDSLTGLPNRVGFTEAIEQARELSSGDGQHAVLVVDMLRFSRINESMGGMAGDELLMTFARRLILALRAGDVLARTGGNEFGVLISLRGGIEDALIAAERIRQVIAAPFRLSDLEIRVECAIGVAVMQAGQDSEELFRNAQFAVKQAKCAGRPQVYEPTKATEAKHLFSIEKELLRALD
jgi:diguanylate cyclase (GGDEF)-like protein